MNFYQALGVIVEALIEGRWSAQEWISLREAELEFCDALDAVVVLLRERRKQ